MPIEVQGPLLLREASSDGTARHFYNTSAMDLSELGETGTADNLEAYLNAFSGDAREIFEHFRGFAQQCTTASSCLARLAPMK